MLKNAGYLSTDLNSRENVKKTNRERAKNALSRYGVRHTAQGSRLHANG